MDGSEDSPRKLLYKLAELLDANSSGGKTLEKALKLIVAFYGTGRGAISTIDPDDGRIRISAACGLSPEQIRRGEYLPGEGVTGRVISLREPVYIRDISCEPLFLNRTCSRNPAIDHIAFSCVPIILHGDVIGSLWLDQAPGALRDPEDFLRTLRIIATMLAPLASERKKCRGFPEVSQSPQLGKFVGNSSAMRQIYAHIMQVAPSRLTVFLGGESGTGKELAARAIHEGSPRATGPFIVVNCAAIPENLVESELFGHERGAFTGASQTRKGKFELANHGTLFLDEIGEMSLNVQARLLRVLQDGGFERIGGSALIRTDARVIAATNRDLTRMVEERSFRQDLYYRLNVFPIYMPPLRERTEDIPALARYFLKREADLANRETPEISPEAMRILENYAWPGNIRELENVMERSSLLADGKMILPEHLPENLSLQNTFQASPSASAGGNLRADMEEYEKNAIVNALSLANGRIGSAAKSLGMTERVFSLRLSRYNLDYKTFRKRHNSKT